MISRGIGVSLLLLLAVMQNSFAQAETLAFSTADMPTAAQAMVKDGKPLVLYVSHSSCQYCKLLDREVMPILLNTEQYQQEITLQKMQWDSTAPVSWVNNESLLPDQLVSRYRIIATPTLLFLNSKGEEIAPRLEGFRDADFYWVYLDKKINQARQALARES